MEKKKMTFDEIFSKFDYQINKSDFNMYLMPSSQGSFYKKARLFWEDGKVVLMSYSTNVASYDTNTEALKVEGWFSHTTARHINEFAEQAGFPRMTKSEMIKCNNFSKNAL